MAQTSGVVSVFANKLITAIETLATGTGSQTVFTGLSLGKPPVFIENVQIRYTISSTQYTATSDSNGDFTGTLLDSGTVAEDGTIDLDFTNPPDDMTPIEAISYTAKGLLQKLIEWACGTRYDQMVGTGDDIETTFPFTLSNTPVAKGNARLTFKIGATEYQVFDNGEGEWEHPKISSSSLNYASGVSTVTFADPIADTYDIVCTYCVGQNSGEEGRDWLLLHHRNSQSNTGADAFAGLLLKECWLKNSGGTYKEAVYCGIREAQYLPANFWQWNLNGDYALGNPPSDDAHWNWNSYKTARTTYDATYEHYSYHPSIALKDDSIAYWFYSNKNRIIVVARVTGTIYETAYIGIGLRFSSPDRFAYPVLVIGSIYGNYNYASTLAQHSFIVEAAGGYPLWIYGKSGNFVSATSRKALVPRGSFTDLGSMTSTAGQIVLFPCFVREWDGASIYSLLTQLDGVYAILNDEVESEDLIQVGGQDYLVIQNIFRTTHKDYLAIKMD